MKQRAVWVLPLLLMLLLLGACIGPRPEVVSYDLSAPESPGDPYIMTVVVKNAGRGEGQIEVIGRLLADSSDEVLAQNDELVDLDPHEVVHIAIELRPNEPGSYRPAASVKYPP